MALDLGTKTCGVALTDRSNTLACPYKTFRFHSEDYAYLFSLLGEVIKSEKITHVIIGRPINMDGSNGFATHRSDYLVTEFEKIGIDISFEDERLTSVFAHKILEENGKDSRKSKKLVDTVSACLILESFLRRMQIEGK